MSLAVFCGSPLHEVRFSGGRALADSSRIEDRYPVTNLCSMPFIPMCDIRATRPQQRSPAWSVSERPCVRGLPSAEQEESREPSRGHRSGQAGGGHALSGPSPRPRPPVPTGHGHGALSAAPAACSERGGPPVVARELRSRPRPRERPAPCSWRSWRRICTLWRKRSPQSSHT